MRAACYRLNNVQCSPLFLNSAAFSSAAKKTTSTESQGVEPGYLGYLSNAVSSVISAWSGSIATTSQKKVDLVEKRPRIILKTSRNAVTNVSRAIVEKILLAETTESRLLRIRELVKHIQDYPPTRLSVAQEPRLISLLLKLESSSSSEEPLRCDARLCLSMCGYVRPSSARGINLLCIDGGGTRGMMGLEVLEAIEEAAGGKKIHELFDHIVGVSTGGIIAVMLGMKKMSVSDCRKTYMDISKKLFSQSRISGATGLILNHSYYDTKKWIGMLKEILGEESLASSAKEKGVPNVCIISSIVNLPILQPYVFRNYEHPAGHDSHYRGGTHHPIWQAVQASAAAPGYFEEVVIESESGTILHQDGGVIANNPTAIGIHETKTLRPMEALNCLVSVGNGRSVHELEPAPLFSATKAHHKLLKIIDSATDTEAVHLAMHFTLDDNVYYRLNPYMSQTYGLDEIDPKSLDQMVTDAKLYVRRNTAKIEAAAERLCIQPSITQKALRLLNDVKDRSGFYSPQ